MKNEKQIQNQYLQDIITNIVTYTIRIEREAWGGHTSNHDLTEQSTETKLHDYIKLQLILV